MHELAPPALQCLQLAVHGRLKSGCYGLMAVSRIVVVLHGDEHICCSINWSMAHDARDESQSTSMGVPVLEPAAGSSSAYRHCVQGQLSMPCPCACMLTDSQV
jgi:hypothetical protein